MKWKNMVLALGVSTLMLSSCGGGNESTTTSGTQERVDSTAKESTAVVVQESTVTPETPAVTVEALGSGAVKWTEEAMDGFTLVYNEGGATLGYSPKSGVELIQVEGFAFKDLNRNGSLDSYEDWRLDADTRASDLAAQLPMEARAGLMLHHHVFAGVGKNLDEVQTTYYDNFGRTYLNFVTAASLKDMVAWNNTQQAYVEAMDFGIPVIKSENPRFDGFTSWPQPLALAATFNPEYAANAGEISSTEWRAMGVQILLGPQVEITTEPRWNRIQATFGEDPALASDMSVAYVNALQSSYENGEDMGWGDNSMISMIKHWPGDGPGESGRESHARSGNATVYPGGQFETHLIPFLKNMELPGLTKSAMATMTSYSIAFDADEAYGELVASPFSEYKVDEVLRAGTGFDGVVTTDWGSVAAIIPGMDPMPYGVEDFTEAERALLAFSIGVDQIGGYGDVELIKEAYEIGVFDFGEEVMDDLFFNSARRILHNMFLVGLFENAYIDYATSQDLIMNDESVEKAATAHKDSVVMLKNKDNVIAESTDSSKPTVYIPMVYREAEAPSIAGAGSPAGFKTLIDVEVAKEYFNVVTDTITEELTGSADAEGTPTIGPADIVRADVTDCDFALVVMENPKNKGGYLTGYGFDGENYIPISLQYGDYTADSEFVRKESISGDMIPTEQDGVYGVQIVEVKENRSYFGNSANILNAGDLETLKETRTLMGDKPVITLLETVHPIVTSEIDAYTDALLVSFGTEDSAILEVVSGKHEPKGLLPMQFPKDMIEVEKQFEDVPRDMVPYTDSQGNTYDFTFGLNWSGVISDARTAKYAVAPLIGTK